MKGSYGSSRAYEIKISSGGSSQFARKRVGFAKNPKTILCLHGFTQCSLDFSVLASFSQKVIELFVQILLEEVSPHG